MSTRPIPGVAQALPAQVKRRPRRAGRLQRSAGRRVVRADGGPRRGGVQGRLRGLGDPQDLPSHDPQVHPAEPAVQGRRRLPRLRRIPTVPRRLPRAPERRSIGCWRTIAVPAVSASRCCEPSTGAVGRAFPSSTSPTGFTAGSSSGRCDASSRLGFAPATGRKIISTS